MRTHCQTLCCKSIWKREREREREKGREKDVWETNQTRNSFIGIIQQFIESQWHIMMLLIKREVHFSKYKTFFVFHIDVCEYVMRCDMWWWDVDDEVLYENKYQNEKHDEKSKRNIDDGDNEWKITGTKWNNNVTITIIIIITTRERVRKNCKRDDIYLALLRSMSCWRCCFRPGLFHIRRILWYYWCYWGCWCWWCYYYIFLCIRWLDTAHSDSTSNAIDDGRCDRHSCCDSNGTIAMYWTFVYSTTN